MSGAWSSGCPACGAPDPRAFHHERGVPAGSCVLLDSREEALAYPRGDLELRLCERCGFIGNAAFQPHLAEYSARYEETQGFSRTFTDFAWGLAKRWVEDHELQGATVLEIGCGKGEFLEMMCEAGVGRGIGIDPSAHPERRTSEAASRIEWITERYSEAHAELRPDAVVCRHTLEHIPDVGAFLATLRRSLGDRLDTVVLFDLPDVGRVLDEVAFWDVYYEHCSYFSAGSLARLFRSSGFEVTDLRVEYADQFLVLEARPAPTIPAAGDPLPLEDDLDHLRAGAARFSADRDALLEGWRQRLASLRSAGGTAAVWGAGSKGVSFLTGLGEPTSSTVAAAVDINPYKHGRSMPGTGQPIVGPEALTELRPDLIVVMNPVYVPEIREELARIGLDPEVVAL